MSLASSRGQTAAVVDGLSPASGHGEPLMALGHCLRRAREARGLSRPELAGRLRIGMEQLQALESADRERLPEMVFVVAQARRVAETLQIDIAAELQALRGAGQRPATGPSRRPPIRIQPSSVSSGARKASSPCGSSQDRRGAAAASIPPRWIVKGKGRPLLAACGMAVALSTLLGVWRFHSPAPLRVEAPQPAVPAAAPEAASGGGVLSRPSDAAATPQDSAGTTASVGIPDSAGPTAAVVAGAVAEGSVVLESSEASWVEVRSVDGATLFRGLLRGARLFRLGEGLEVLAGRPDLVSTRVGAAPAQVLGPISEVRWRSLPAGR